MKKFFNRELSWIEFNARVLAEAQSPDVPLFERLKFLGITETNFDEFFQVRVASIKRSAKDRELFLKISQRASQVVRKEYEILSSSILPELEKVGLKYVVPSEYTESQKSFAESFFKHDIFPILTPLRTDGDMFPAVGNLNLNVAFLLRRMEGIPQRKDLLDSSRNETIALVQIPSVQERIVWLPSANGDRPFALLDDIISTYGDRLFPGYEATETLVFKICRDADFAVDEDSDQFIKAMQEVLVKRKSSFVVRMEYKNTSEKILGLLKEKFSLAEEDLYEASCIIDPSTLASIGNVDNAADLKYPVWNNSFPKALPHGETYWNTLRQHDVLLHVPYESYDPVVEFISQAAEDENVLAIKMTLYRTGSNSPIVRSLKQAAQNGKQVIAFVELKARFDEQRNMEWAKELERAGVIVVYGIVNLKVHAKICLVVRKESDGLRRYVHIGTGNYNPKTALLYQDLSIFTSNHDFAVDATLFFNIISGYSALQTMHFLYMAPVTLKQRLLEMIEREIQLSTRESPGMICAKMNSLCHPEIIEALYRASRAGVKIMLNVRGICTLVPGEKGMSENITVVSVIDRYLEHSRIFYFQNGGTEELYLSSADWMERNLDRRVELMFPVTDRTVFRQVREILFLYFTDNTHSHVLLKSGTWKKKKPQKKEQAVRVQEVLYKKYRKRNEVKKNPSGAEFIVRRKDVTE